MSKLLYPPAGGEAVLAHDTQVEQMKNKGWLETNPNTGNLAKPTPSKKVNKDGES